MKKKEGGRQTMSSHLEVMITATDSRTYLLCTTASCEEVLDDLQNTAHIEVLDYNNRLETVLLRTEHVVSVREHVENNAPYVHKYY